MLGLCLAGLLSLASATTSAQADGSLSVPLRDASGNSGLVVEEVRLYRASYALVIGNDNYTNGWPRLSMAVNDARIIAEELKRQGFDVTLKTDLKSAELDQALREFFIVKGDDAEARLFLWYAGHGDTENGEGFLVPTDAPRADLGTKFTLAALPMRRFGEYVRLAKAKHVYAVFDSCFAGTIFEAERGLPPRAITRATALPVRQFLTSGDASQTVFDNGTFRELFLRALRGEEGADANGDGFVTGTEIGLFLTDRITNLTRSRQTPRYGKLLDKDLDRGDFVFRIDGAAVLAQAPPIAEPPPPPAAAGGPTRSSEALMVEMAFWDAIKNSTNPGDYKAYLEAYPQGRFAPLARVRAAGAAAPAATPPAAAPPTATPPAAAPPAAPPAPPLGPPPAQVATRSAPAPDPAAEAKAKADAEAKARAEADAQRRAAEEKARQQAEAEKQRKAAEDKARQRAEADKQRQAEEAERQRKAEADAQRRAAEVRKPPAPPALAAVAPPPPAAAAPPAPPPSTGFRPPAVGTRFHYDNGGTVTVESVDAQTLHLVNAQGRRFNFVSCCWDGDFLQLQGQYPFKELWPLKVGNRIQFTVAGYLASETWVHTLKVLRQERVRVPAGEFDTFVIELEKRGVAQNTHRSTQTYWFAPELGFPVRLEVSLLSGTTGARSWQLARIERPNR